ncbi:Hexose carrier protein HEX6 [Hibiscus syriacus]|uniref:Hexose carrier protein HEX6 n=1 Tax=Hibiscus syriacus TaxID=106335 RepID=A0A6A3B5Q1_HIBSY|nr:Hexose carrier protein HEX6 [Hibiscus syriacus]
MVTALQMTSETGQYNGRITLLLLLSCFMAFIGGVLFGYDLGVSGGVTSMEPFLKEFFPMALRPQSIHPGRSSCIPGALFSEFHILYFNTAEYCLELGSDLPTRGALNIGFEAGVSIGVLVANLTNYFTEKINGGWGWRISLVMAAVPDSIITLTTFLLPETPNSLIQQSTENHEKAKHARAKAPRYSQTVVTGLVGLASILIFMFAVDKFGRSLFMVGGSLMLVPQVVMGGILAAKLSDEGALGHGCAYLVLVLICIYVVGFALSWGPLGWLVPSEIYPLEIRSAGQSITVSMGFLLCFVVEQTFLAMFCHMKWVIFYFFGAWVVAMTAFVYFLLPETKNLPVEQMEVDWREHWFWRRFVEDDVKF